MRKERSWIYNFKTERQEKKQKELQKFMNEETNEERAGPADDTMAIPSLQRHENMRHGGTALVRPTDGAYFGAERRRWRPTPPLATTLPRGGTPQWADWLLLPQRPPEPVTEGKKEEHSLRTMPAELQCK